MLEKAMETTSSFGYWIRRQRKALDLTQQALAERVGCSVAAIKKMFKQADGIHRPYRVLFTLANKPRAGHTTVAAQA
jgi:transcriptional regulator with XRE-family HTH domain